MALFLCFTIGLGLKDRLILRKVKKESGMRRILSGLLVLTAVLTLTACGGMNKKNMDVGITLDPDPEIGEDAEVLFSFKKVGNTWKDQNVPETTLAEGDLTTFIGDENTPLAGIPDAISPDRAEEIMEVIRKDLADDGTITVSGETFIIEDPDSYENMWEFLDYLSEKYDEEDELTVGDETVTLNELRIIIDMMQGL